MPWTSGPARALALGAVLALAAGQCGRAAADDSEIYFGRVDRNSDHKPNVLFVLDTSGSMTEKDGTGESRLDRMKRAMRDLLTEAEDLNAGLMQFNGSYGGGPILYPVTDIDEQVCDGEGCGGRAVFSRVRDDADDVEEYGEGSDHTLLVNGDVLNLTDEGGREQLVGLRFPSLTIPRGARIVDAWLELSAYRDSDDGDVGIEIRAERSGDAASFDADARVGERDWDSASALWKPEKWTRDALYRSGDLSSIVQRVTDRDDWCGGNALALRLGTPDGTSNGSVRDALTTRSVREQGRGEVPTLRVLYDASELSGGEGCVRRTISVAVADGDDDAEEELDGGAMTLGSGDLDVPAKSEGVEQMAGIRFRDVDIPRDARIRSARIDLDIKERYDNGGGLDLYIAGEDDKDAKAFRSRRRDLSKRDLTTVRVEWEDVPDPPAGTIVSTPDVSPIVAEIVANKGWKAGNAVTFLIGGDEDEVRRSFKSYDKTRSTQPRLTVEFEDEGGSGEPSGGGTTIDARRRMLDIVDSLSAEDGTPIVDTLYEATRYFRGDEVIFGKRRGDPFDVEDGNWKTDDKRRYYRVSHPGAYANGRLVRPSKCEASDPTSKDCVLERIDGSPVYTSPIVGECQTNHIVLLSDGEADDSYSRGLIPDFIDKDSCAPDTDEEICGTDLVEWLYQNDHSSSVDRRQNVRTHTIAFNLNKPVFLKDLADAGGGGTYEASSADELLGAFRSILDIVNSVDTSFTAPGATVNQFNRLTHRDDIYFAMFKPTDAPRWSGNVKRFRIGKAKDGSGEVLIRDRDDKRAVDPVTGFFDENAKSFWPEKDADGAVVTAPDGHNVTRGGAAGQQKLEDLERIDERRTYTWTGEADSVPAGGVDLTETAQELDESNTAITDSMLGLGSVSGDATVRAAYRERLLEWARGVDVLDADAATSERPRRHMGDPMHSRPVILNYAKEDENDEDTDESDAGDSEAGDGDEDAQEEDVRSIVFVATNEGYLHAIDTENGEEQFAFMPRELLGNLKTQFENSPGVDHPYGLDGPLSIFRVDTNGNHIVDPGEKAYLYVGMRRGGSAYYALDVSELDKPRLAWAIVGGEDGSDKFEQLGQSWSRMTPVRMMIGGEKKDVLIFGGGYDEKQDDAQVATDTLLGARPQKGRGLYIVAADTGGLLWSGLGGTGGSQRFTDMRYPIPGNVRAIDTNRDGLVDQVYAGDTGGQLWRFDVAQYHESGVLMSGGVIADLSGSARAEQRRFYTEPDVALIEEGSERFLTISIGSGWRAHPLDEDVEDRFYMIRQRAVRAAPDGYGKHVSASLYRPLVNSDLTPVADTLDPSVGEHGWYLDFATTGEKVMSTSVTFDSSVVFSTYVPEASVARCSTGIGGGRAYVLDVASGRPVHDLDGDKDIDGDDRGVDLQHEGLPPDATILLTEDGGDKPEILLGGEQLETGIVNRTRRTFWSDLGSEGEVVQADADGEKDVLDSDDEGGDDDTDVTQ